MANFLHQAITLSLIFCTLSVIVSFLVFLIEVGEFQFLRTPLRPFASYASSPPSNRFG